MTQRNPNRDLTGRFTTKEWATNAFYQETIKNISNHGYYFIALFLKLHEEQNKRRNHYDNNIKEVTINE
jgi:hypothetical protein